MTTISSQGWACKMQLPSAKVEIPAVKLFAPMHLLTRRRASTPGWKSLQDHLRSGLPTSQIEHSNRQREPGLVGVSFESANQLGAHGVAPLGRQGVQHVPS